jgi:hypothetical protein
MKPRDPQTPQEWQAAVNSADFHLCLKSARAYGLVATDVVVDLDRCEELLKRGEALGYKPNWSPK